MDMKEMKYIDQRDNIRDVLNKAADVIEARGLAKHIPRDGNGRVCVMEAIYIAAGSTFTGEGCHAVYRVRQFLGVRLEVWNDRPETTQDMVVSTLRKVAQL